MVKGLAICVGFSAPLALCHYTFHLIESAIGTRDATFNDITADFSRPTAGTCLRCSSLDSSATGWQTGNRYLSLRLWRHGSVNCCCHTSVRFANVTTYKLECIDSNERKESRDKSGKSREEEIEGVTEAGLSAEGPGGVI